MTFKTEKEMFVWIWTNRPTISEVSGKPLLGPHDSRWHWQFAHILPKGRFPSCRLDPDNIMLMLPEEHENQERYEVFQKRKEELMARYYREQNLLK